MELTLGEQSVSSGEQLYRDTSDQWIEQSAIYSQVSFDTAGRELPAVVLTPYCDILHPGKDFLVTVAALLPAQLVFEEFLEKRGLTQEEIVGVKSIRPKTHRAIVEDFTEQYLQNRALKYHFLPACRDKLGHSFVYFRVVRTVTAKELRDKSKIAVLKSPWRESVPSRYAAYSLRIGVLDFSDEFLRGVVGEISKLQVSS